MLLKQVLSEVGAAAEVAAPAAMGELLRAGCIHALPCRSAAVRTSDEPLGSD